MSHVIFFSAVSDEFRSYRVPLRRDLDRPTVSMKIQEDFVASGSPTLDKLDDYIRASDVVVHLVGALTGAVAERPSLDLIRARYPDLGERLPPLGPVLEGEELELTYTQWEAWLALYHGKPLVIAAPEDEAVRDRTVADEDQRRRQRLHLDRLAAMERFPEIRFRDADRLAVGILSSTPYRRLVSDDTVAERNRDALQRYVAAALASFRLDGAGLAVDGASGHALGIGDAYAGMSYAVNGDRIALAQLLERRRRLVLLGGPGTGKSVTLERLLADASARDGRVPVFLRLADYASGQPEGADLPMASLFQAFADGAAALGVTGLDAAAFEDLAVREGAIIGLDGYDEIGGRAARERVAAGLGQLADAHPDTTIVVTSRPDEYRTTPLPASTAGRGQDFVVAETQPLEGGQIRAFLAQSFGDDGSLWRAIRQDEDLQELARTPLVLTLLGLLGRAGPLPSGQLALYDAVVRTAIDSWEARKGAGRESAGGDAQRALEELCLFLHQRETPAEPVPVPRAVRAVGGDAELIDWLVERTGLLERGEERGAQANRPVVRLVHLQVQEYLTGRALARRLVDTGDDGTAALDRWGMEPGWAEPQRFAAAALAEQDELAVLEGWVARRLDAIEALDAGGPEPPDRDGVVVTARLLAEADAAFLPAVETEDRLVRLLAGVHDALAYEDDVHLLCALAPRPASLAAVTQVARQTPEGLGWLGRGAPVPDGGTGNRVEEALAAAASVVARFAGDEDARVVLEWVVDTAPRLSTMAAWARLAPAVEERLGVGREAFLRSLAFSDQWLMDALAGEVVDLLDAVERAGSGDLARRFALEGADRGAHEAATGGFVEWLAHQGDPDALSVADRYHERLADLIERTDPDHRWALPWDYLDLWPDRDSPAADRLRRAALANRTAAWNVRGRAIRDPRYVEPATAAWLSIAGEEPEPSRRNSVIYEMTNEPDDGLAAPLLLGALRHHLVRRWSGEAVVRRLVELGRAAEVREVLAGIEDAPDGPDGPGPLLELLDGLEEDQSRSRTS